MVAIKDMAIPSCCGECDFCTDNWECILLRKRTNNIVGANAKLSDCPLVEIGICKDCKYRSAIYADGRCFCDNDETFKERNFYCKDFEKRGAESE